MPYFKWKAYGSDIKYKDDGIDKYYEGAIESDRYEMAILELSRTGLVVKELTKIDYIEFRRLKKIESKLEILRRHINKAKTPEAENPRNWRKALIISAIAIGIVVLLIALSNLQYSHRF